MKDRGTEKGSSPGFEEMKIHHKCKRSRCARSLVDAHAASLDQPWLSAGHGDVFTHCYLLQTGTGGVDSSRPCLRPGCEVRDGAETSAKGLWATGRKEYNLTSNTSLKRLGVVTEKNARRKMRGRI